MKYLVLIGTIVLALGLANVAPAFESVGGGGGCHGCCDVCNNAQWYPWHGWYYNAEWGAPVALVVPPTAEEQTHFTWGVPSSHVTWLCPRFKLGFPGCVPYNRYAFRPTPPWPYSTDQQGYYYVHGPW
jgi:hypothetical protein